MTLDLHAALLAVDPGVRGCGVSIWRREPNGVTLAHAAYVKNSVTKGGGPFVAREMAIQVLGYTLEHAVIVDRLALEFPQVYTQGKLKGDPNDLLDLAAVDAAIITQFAHREGEWIRPREWKGQLPKEAADARIMKRLSVEETHVLVKAHDSTPKSLFHNVMDAVGIGLFALGRFDPVRVIAR